MSVLAVLQVWAFVTGEWKEAPPSADPLLILRDVVIALAVATIVWEIRPRGLLSGKITRHPWIIGTVLFVLCITAVLIVSPDLYHVLAQEDGIAEWLSALALLAAAVRLEQGAVRRFRSGDLRLAVILQAGAGLGLLMALEEISWGQRIFDIQASGAFETRNFQGETNLHNFATNQIELVFYLGALALLTFWPLLVENPDGPGDPPDSWAGLVARLRPSTSTALVAALTAGLTYDQWNVLTIQGAVTGTILLLVTAARRMPPDSPGRRLISVVAATVVASQLTLFALGDRMTRPWDVTEFRELVIAVALALYAWEVVGRVDRERRVADTSV